ncbi:MULTISPECIES: rhamnan synthesis F family protein [unclassified Prochlorococcus]|uniref:rhamnan synthesis F family protein n=1 Tax=Prochlorococcus TaxID=1218 RepID=UPI00351B63E0
MPIIQPTNTIKTLLLDSQVALHIHVFYPELLTPILKRLENNKLRPDQFLTYSNPKQKPLLESVLD